MNNLDFDCRKNMVLEKYIEDLGYTRYNIHQTKKNKPVKSNGAS